jgi:Fe2+ or Zn2+ uptake regulation protein
LAAVRSEDELSHHFRSLGLKLTPQRQCVFRVLERTAGSHPSAEVVHAAVLHQLPMVSLKTVYQALNDLVSMGELRRLELGVGPARFDVAVGEHHHLLCDRCGRIWDTAADAPAPVLPPAAEGFAVAAADIVFRGRCGTCRTAGTDPHDDVPRGAPVGTPSEIPTRRGQRPRHNRRRRESAWPT